MPQFRFVLQPMLIMLAAGVGLVAVRLWAGRGTALGAVAFFLALRGGLALAVGPVLGETTPHFPLYVVEALVVEGVALLLSAERRPLAFGLWSGAGIGTLGLAAEWGWSHVWMPIPWPAELLPEAALFGFATAIVGGVLGAWIGSHLAVTPRPRSPRLRGGAVVAAAALAAMLGVALYKPADEGVRADLTLTDVSPPPERRVAADVRLDPADAADDAEWLTVTAWQGGGLVVDRLERIGPGRYRTTKPIPVHGEWKALIRLHSGNSLTGLPIFLPRDSAIPAKEVPAPTSFSRTFIADHEILQREQKSTAAGLTAIGYGIALAIALSLFALLAWGLHRLAVAPERQRPAPPPPAPASAGPRSRPRSPATA